MSGELLPCPFCGGAPTVDERKRKVCYDDEWSRVSCGRSAISGKGDCTIGPSTGYFSGPDGMTEAIAAWNRRALPAPEEERP